jgi:hypothetical protein
MRSIVSRLTPVLLVFAAAGSAVAQGMPTSQPGYITIYREFIKTGRAADHARIESGWPAAFERAGSPENYLAIESMTGATEVWFLAPYASYAAMEADTKRNNSDPVLAADLERLSRADAEAVDATRGMVVRARPDLSMGAFPNLAKVRFYEVTTFRVRIGQEQAFEAASKAWMASAKRNAPNTAYRTYSLVAGGMAGTYLVFTSLESYADLDRLAANGDKIWSGMTPQEQAVMDKGVGGIISIETQHFRVDPVMSYVDKATRDQDPAFWSPTRGGSQ